MSDEQAQNVLMAQGYPWAITVFGQVALSAVIGQPWVQRKSIFYPFAIYTSLRDGVAIQTMVINPAYGTPSRGRLNDIDPSVILGDEDLSPNKHFFFGSLVKSGPL